MGEGPAGDFPVPLTPLIGRERELAGARVLLAGGRLLTLVGAGGIRHDGLALEVVGGEPGAVFVDLAPVREPGQFCQRSPGRSDCAKRARSRFR